ncbi:hypothetical protein LA080_008140 [Diaporthe eres]|nr:hypothetical protein LA080_008140 [Diaporthe eres]
MRINIPEHFIWLVAEQIGEALVYMHLGRPRGSSGPGAYTRVEGWKPIYHRDIADSNIFLHYPTTSRSELDMYRDRAFPQVVLGDWGEAAIDGDGPANLQRGTPPASTISPELREWTDVHQFGRVLRLLCMAHVDLDIYSAHDEDEDQYDEIEDYEDESWELDRPDSQTLENCNAYGAEAVYSDELIRFLQMFERPDMDTVAIVDQTQYVPTMEWIASTFLPMARSRVQLLRQPAMPTADYYKTLDVSWTKPADPVSVTFGSGKE